MKNLFSSAMDELLSSHGLSTKCELYYDAPVKSILCNNCLIDPISQISSNIYNGTGPVPFADQTICPVCAGGGMMTGEKTETVYLGVIFDNKYFMKMVDTARIYWPNNSIQTICSITLLPKLKAASRLQIDGTAAKYANYSYVRESEPQPCGFGNNNYIVTLWKTA